MTLRILIALFVGFSFGSGAQAQATPTATTDGNYLLGSCRSSVQGMDNPDLHQNLLEAWRSGLCAGIVRGVWALSLSVCAPQEVTAGQSIRIVYKYLQDHPEQLQMFDTKLVDLALTQAFPCKK
jgi:Ssp1 endopeptidase immunity protein Rap1a